MPSGKRIVYVIPSGAAFVRHHLALAVRAARNNDVHALVAVDDDRCAATIAAAGIHVHETRISRKSLNPMDALREVRTLRGRIRGLRPDIINAINLKAVLVAALANRGGTARLVGTIPGLGYLFARDSLKRRILRWRATGELRRALRRQNHVLILSNRDDLHEMTMRRVTAPERMTIIPVPGIDTTAYAPQPEPETGYRVVLPARMLWEKGVGEFVTAAERLRGAIPDAEYLLAGMPDQGNPSSIPEEQLRRWDEAGAVRWLGQCDDMPALMASCHVVCLPSKYREGFPRALAEAMACGRPVVTTDAPGCRDIGSAGLVVPQGDPADLADALLRLAHTPTLRHALASAGRDRAVKEFDAETVEQRVLATYDREWAGGEISGKG